MMYDAEQPRNVSESQADTHPADPPAVTQSRVVQDKPRCGHERINTLSGVG